MRKFSIMASLLMIPLFLVVFGQGCSRGLDFSQVAETPIHLEASSGNGGTYDGKLRILHHYVDQFTCEGRPQPESILIRDNETDWYLIRNTSDKCAFINRVPVQGVQYDETANQAIFNQDLYVPPHPYFVSASEDPNLPDVRLEDGVCEDTNGICSLRASIDQAGTTSVTEAVIVHIPAGTYGLTNPLSLSSKFTNGKAVTLRGANPMTTILDGKNLILPLIIDMATSSLVSIENMTIQNGKGPGAFSASAIYPARGIHEDNQLEVTNCIFKNNKGNAAIYGGPGSGNIRIRKSQFIGSDLAAIQVFAVASLLVEDTLIDNNSGYGIWVNNGTPKVTIRRSTISNNGRGISFHKCSSCLIENVTVSQNQYTGVDIFASVPDPSLDVVINNSTIFGNGLTSGENLKLQFYDSTNKLLLNNSILAMNNVSKQNCLWDYPGNPSSHTIIATNSLFDDSSCGQLGSGNILANPQLGPLTNNGGLTPTMRPLLGSPAIDAGFNNFCSKEDQRSLPRPIDQLGAGPRCDIGAVELQ